MSDEFNEALEAIRKMHGFTWRDYLLYISSALAAGTIFYQLLDYLLN